MHVIEERWWRGWKGHPSSTVIHFISRQCVKTVCVVDWHRYANEPGTEAVLWVSCCAWLPPASMDGLLAGYPKYSLTTAHRPHLRDYLLDYLEKPTDYRHRQNGDSHFCFNLRPLWGVCDEISLGQLPMNASALANQIFLKKFFQKFLKFSEVSNFVSKNFLDLREPWGLWICTCSTHQMLMDCENEW